MENTPTPENSTQLQKGDILSTITSVESQIFGLSVRGFLALILVAALVIYPFFNIVIPVQVSTLAVAVCAFYFGKNQK